MARQILRNSSLIYPKRPYHTPGCADNRRKGLILGNDNLPVYKPNPRKLTATAEKYNRLVKDRLKQLQILVMPPPDKGQVRIFYEQMDEGKEAIRIATGSACRELKICLESFGHAESAAEDTALAVWLYLEKKAKEKQLAIPQLELYDDCNWTGWQIGLQKAAAQNLVRQLMDTPFNLMTSFEKNAVKLLCKFNINFEVKVRGWAETQNINAFLAKQKYMRGDMGGAAIIVASCRAVAGLQLKLNVRGLIPLCENMPGCAACGIGGRCRAAAFLDCKNFEASCCVRTNNGRPGIVVRQPQINVPLPVQLPDAGIQLGLTGGNNPTLTTDLALANLRYRLALLLGLPNSTFFPLPGINVNVTPPFQLPDAGIQLGLTGGYNPTLTTELALANLRYGLALLLGLPNSTFFPLPGIDVNVPSPIQLPDAGIQLGLTGGNNPTLNTELDLANLRNRLALLFGLPNSTFFPLPGISFNGTIPIPSLNGTISLPLFNGTIPISSLNGTISLPLFNGTILIPSINGTISLPLFNATIPVPSVNITSVPVNISISGTNTTLPNIPNIPNINVIPPDFRNLFPFNSNYSLCNCSNPSPNCNLQIVEKLLDYFLKGSKPYHCNNPKCLNCNNPKCSNCNNSKCPNCINPKCPNCNNPK